jgi:IS1 family transposase
MSSLSTSVIAVATSLSRVSLTISIKIQYDLAMNKLPRDKRIQIVSLLVEGMSLRAVTRVTGVSINTVTKLLIDAGKACSEFQSLTFRNLTCRRIQVDEIWCFCYAKQRNVETAKKAPEGAGDIWTWTAIDADTKLVPSWLIGDRSGETAKAFISDLAGRLVTRVQLTSEGLKSYLQAVEQAFSRDIDYAMLVKHYGEAAEPAGRYSPGICTGIDKEAISGSPDPAHVSTSYSERSNLPIRMHMRRFTGLTNAFSKKVENHGHSMALHFMAYNFVRIHGTLRCSPAMAAGVSARLWEIADILTVIENWEMRQDR